MLRYGKAVGAQLLVDEGLVASGPQRHRSVEIGVVAKDLRFDAVTLDEEQFAISGLHGRSECRGGLTPDVLIEAASVPLGGARSEAGTTHQRPCPRGGG